MIEHLVPDDIKNLSYYEVSKARGFDLKRFYVKQSIFFALNALHQLIERRVVKTVHPKSQNRTNF